jgi:hypothetical protein
LAAPFQIGGYVRYWVTFVERSRQRLRAKVERRRAERFGSPAEHLPDGVNHQAGKPANDRAVDSDELQVTADL